MSPLDPVTTFPEFYQNPTIALLADVPRWTISGLIGDPNDPAGTSKAPIDFQHLRTAGRVRGAWATDAQCLVDLPTLTTTLPTARNAAFFLNAPVDGVLVLDIEPACPPDIAAALLNLPESLYREYSMSGRGYHLVFPLPDNFHAFPIAADKTVLRESHGWYELLLCHWVTFTRNVLPDSQPHVQAHGVSPSTATPWCTVAELYAELAASAQRQTRGSVAALALSETPPELPKRRFLTQQTLHYATPRIRPPEDFAHDLSRWEFSTLAVLYNGLEIAITRLQQLDGVAASTPDQQVWLLYLIAQEIIPERPKHHTTRNGMPYLRDRAATLVADRLAKKVMAGGALSLGESEG